MAKEQKPAVEQPGGTQEPPQPTQRERYQSRRREAYPDLSEDDEEGWYGQANKDLDEQEGYRKNNQELADVFDKTPTLAGMLLAAKEGENPFVYLAEQAGPDLDIRELINDAEFGSKMTAALDKWQDGQLKSKQAQEEMKSNFQASFDALKQIQQERGMSDDDCLQIIDDFFENVVGNASKGIVSKETWEAFLKAKSYDADVAAAREKGGAQAMNQRIQNPLKNFDDTDMPPTLNAGGAGQGEHQKDKKPSFFDDWEREEEK